MNQLVQLLGAVLILAAFALSQTGTLQPQSYAYLVPNLVGSAALAAVAWMEAQWGFVLLEAVWALVSAWSLGRRWVGQPRPVP